jgi:hypothetical protein
MSSPLAVCLKCYKSVRSLVQSFQTVIVSTYNVSNTISTNIVVLDDAESSTRSLALDELRSSVNVVGSLGERSAVDAGIGDSSVDVLAQRRETESIDVNGATLQTGSRFRRRVATDIRRRREETS